MGKEFFRDFVHHARAEHGFAVLKDVRSKETEDSMESFLFTETFKYRFLPFAPDESA